MPEWSQAQVLAPGLKGAQSFTLKKPWVGTGMKLVEIGEGFITLEVGKAKTLQRCFTEKHVFTGVESPEPVKATSSSSADLSSVAVEGPKSRLKEAMDALANLPGGGKGSGRDANRIGFWNHDFKSKAVTLNRIRRDTPLFKMGLRPNDRLFSINGEKVSHLGDKVQDLFKSMPNDTSSLVFEVQRRGKRIKLQYQP